LLRLQLLSGRVFDLAIFIETCNVHTQVCMPVVTRQKRIQPLAYSNVQFNLFFLALQLLVCASSHSSTALKRDVWISCVVDVDTYGFVADTAQLRYLHTYKYSVTFKMLPIHTKFQGRVIHSETWDVVPSIYKVTIRYADSVSTNLKKPQKSSRGVRNIKEIC
jgi:hypothetical protein